MSKVIVYQGQPTASAAAVFTSARETTIDAAVACNTSASSVNLSVWLVPGGGAAANVNAIYDELSISPNTQVSLALLVNHALPANAELHMQVSTGGTIAVTISGREV